MSPRSRRSAHALSARARSSAVTGVNREAFMATRRGASGARFGTIRPVSASLHSEPADPLPAARPGPALPARILVVRLGAIGDVVNALVFATAIKDASPETEIGWVVHPLARPMVEGHPSVDRVHVWHKGGGRVSS